MKSRMAFGVHTPIIRKGDDLCHIIIDSILEETHIENGDIIGITESIVARAAGLYVTVDDIANSVKSKFGENPNILILNPIYSRNRFSIILKGIARAAKSIILIMPKFDEVGNPNRTNQFTGVNIWEYYRELCLNEKCKTSIFESIDGVKNITEDIDDFVTLNCQLRPDKSSDVFSLIDICNDVNPDFGLLGSNKATDEKLKLFPTKKIAQDLVYRIKDKIKEDYGKDVEVMVYGDGCFKDPVGGIWEFADPVTSPAYTKELEGTPNEIKLKAFADDQFKDLSGKKLEDAIKDAIRSKDFNLIGNMKSQGTTPRRKIDLLASLMDLISGSGDAGTPVVVVRNYTVNYAS